jgi:hypothetical protein
LERRSEKKRPHQGIAVDKEHRWDAEEAQGRKWLHGCQKNQAYRNLR